MFGDKNAQTTYNIRFSKIAGTPSYASLCTECEECLELCPQHLEIPTLLKDVAEEFDTDMPK
jgi:predicted aldo/keto reductase-like oxidoreductase